SSSCSSTQAVCSPLVCSLCASFASSPVDRRKLCVRTSKGTYSSPRVPHQVATCTCPSSSQAPPFAQGSAVPPHPISASSRAPRTPTGDLPAVATGPILVGSFIAPRCVIVSPKAMLSLQIYRDHV